ncbi:hypothetical protein [Streptomyces sp. SP18CS02]|uniref:hypothetical protein n=1 Tax=Streptomyces sp. SP18CS02 TaxID=3002531 RepID=UPI002E7A1463|nr:hypothetical protein [Streptomyces sp. SP18CS02]MEE1756524.1 hypothetical protein [Streptomyces sp. SP18CS02]
MGTLTMTTFRRRAYKGTGTGIGTLLLVLAAGCTDGKPEDAATPAKTGQSSPPGHSGFPTDQPSKDLTVLPPRLPEGKVVAQVANAQGNREVSIEDRVDEGALGILVACRGKGTITVTYTPSAISFPLNCTTGETSTTYNQIDLKREQEAASIKVDAPSAVRWAMTVGQSDSEGGPGN